MPRNHIVKFLSMFALLSAWTLVLMACTSQFIDTNDAIHSFLVFDYNDDDLVDPTTAAPHAMFVWGMDPVERDRIPAYRASNPNIVLSRYIRFGRDTDDNRTLGWWQSNHPDWVVYECDRTTPAWWFDRVQNVPIDLSNPAVTDWLVENYLVPASIDGFDAIALDGFHLDNYHGACGVYRNGEWVQLYTGEYADPNYTQDVLAWTKVMSSKSHTLRPKPLLLIPNFTVYDRLSSDRARDPSKDPDIVKLVANMDGILDEGSFYPNTYYLTDTKWENNQKYIEYVQARGKAYFSINAPPRNQLVDETVVNWTLASYLMSKEHASAIYLTSFDDYDLPGYGYDAWRGEYEKPIGTPCGAMQETQGVFSREFEHALAIVNPSGPEDPGKDFILPQGSFTDLYGHMYEGGGLTIPRHSGLVLLAEEPRCGAEHN